MSGASGDGLNDKGLAWDDSSGNTCLFTLFMSVSELFGSSPCGLLAFAKLNQLLVMAGQGPVSRGKSRSCEAL